MLRLFLVFLIFDASPFSSFSNTVSENQLFFNFFPGGWNLHVPDFIAYSSLSQVVSLQDTGLTCHLQRYIQVCGMQSPLHTFFSVVMPLL